MALLELQNVCKGYGFGARRVEVLHDINLAIAEGEFVAIVGYSGAGKTTLMSLIAGLQRPDAGTVTLRGEEITEPSPDRAIVFQNYSLLPWLSVFENIALAVNEVFRGWSREQRREHIEKFIAMVNLTAARDKKPRELSGGMRQRVSVARALAMNPRVLLLDEPLSALDALTRATLQEEIERIWESDRKTVVLITNDVDEGILLADRIIPLSAGPRATLGPAVTVGIERPRDRKMVAQDPRFSEVRQEVIDYLLGAGGRPRQSVTRRLVLPDVEPEDLNAPRRWTGRRARRKHEEKTETIEVA
jgi:nitrate/nitrite transport system ATP-binding protein